MTKMIAAFRKPHQETIAQRLMGETYLPSRNRVFNLIAFLQGNKAETDPFNYEDMARMSGQARATFARSLAQLVEDGHIMVKVKKAFVNGLWVNAANAYAIVRQSMHDLREMLDLKKKRDAARNRRIAALSKRHALSLMADTTIESIQENRTANVLQIVPDRTDPAYWLRMKALPDSKDATADMRKI